jgi:hypothetical protein
MSCPPHWTVISSHEVLDASPFLKVRVETIELPDGRRIPNYYQLETPSFACIFAETIDGRIIVYRQYRHGTRRVGLAFPGGHLEDGEDLHQATEAAAFDKTNPFTGLGGVCCQAQTCRADDATAGQSPTRSGPRWPDSQPACVNRHSLTEPSRSSVWC